MLPLTGHCFSTNGWAFCPEMAAAENVVLFTLPPNTTHICQPLDKGPFGPLKLVWRKTVHTFIASNEGCTVTQYDFSQLFAETWFKAMTMKNSTAGFKTTGVFPFNKQAVKLLEDKPTVPLTETSSLPFVPLFNPSQPASIKPKLLFLLRLVTIL